MIPDEVGLPCLIIGSLILLYGIATKVRCKQPRTGRRGAEDELLPNILTVHQAFEGVLGIGGIGSGKSSILAWLMKAMMQRGFGMVILTAKPDDFDAIRRVAKEAGRLGDLIRFAPEERWRLDFIEYELNRPGGSVASVGQFMQDLLGFSTRTQMSSSTEPFWEIATGRKVRMELTILNAALEGQVSMQHLCEFNTSMPSSRVEADSRDFRESFCGQMLRQAFRNAPDDPDVEMAAGYVVLEWAKLSEGDRTAQCIEAHVMNLLERFMQGRVRELCASGGTNVSPDSALRGKIIAVDLPILKYREPGQFTQMGWKLLFQRAALSRTITSNSLPVCLWADEGSSMPCRR